MALQSSGAISLSQIQTEFGGVAPISLTEYYGKDTVPSSGALSMTDFYGTTDLLSFNGTVFPTQLDDLDPSRSASVSSINNTSYSSYIGSRSTSDPDGPTGSNSIHYLVSFPEIATAFGDLAGTVVPQGTLNITTANIYMNEWIDSFQNASNAITDATGSIITLVGSDGAGGIANLGSGFLSGPANVTPNAETNWDIRQSASSHVLTSGLNVQHLDNWIANGCIVRIQRKTSPNGHYSTHAGIRVEINAQEA